MDRIAEPENQRLEYQDESGPTTQKYSAVKAEILS